MTELIEDQKKDGTWGNVYNWIIEDQNSFFLKIVHIYSITIFETFSQEFFTELNKEKILSKKMFVKNVAMSFTIKIEHILINKKTLIALFNG